MGLPKAEHPLISVINLAAISPPVMEGPRSLVFDFYSISLKKNFNARMRYGQQPYDFDEGLLHFMAPGQVLTIEWEKGANMSRRGGLS